MGKRVFDVIVALVLLIVLLPLLCAIAIAVRLESDGPSLFRQERITRGGRVFRMLKFRSMRHATSLSGPLITADGDSRVTRVGAFLRRTKLDELPQLLNVLKGDMSMVGPRPEVPKYVAMYPSVVRDLVLSVRPGITDEASLLFRDEGALLARADDHERMYVSVILPQKLDMYARYARTHSLAGDIRLLLRTAWLLVPRSSRR
jgi:lipopolysaccharide/colanic/teichoic acid biosynthesis glycosyltransferase